MGTQWVADQAVSLRSAELAWILQSGAQTAFKPAPSSVLQPYRARNCSANFRCSVCGCTLARLWSCACPWAWLSAAFMKLNCAELPLCWPRGNWQRGSESSASTEICFAALLQDWLWDNETAGRSLHDPSTEWLSARQTNTRNFV